MAVDVACCLRGFRSALAAGSHNAPCAAMSCRGASGYCTDALWRANNWFLPVESPELSRSSQTLPTSTRLLMRLSGNISGWNDDKGYGFVTPHEGGDRAFVHINAFQAISRRPMNGDNISFVVVKDSKGRTNAMDVHIVGQETAKRRAPKPIPRKPMPRIAIGMLYLLAVAVAVFLGLLPAIVLIGYLFLSCISYIMYTSDKAAAVQGIRRMPESSLHCFDLLGGWPGGLIAQQRSRHKTAKASFQTAFWLTVLVNIASVAWFARIKLAHLQTATLLGG